MAATPKTGQLSFRDRNGKAYGVTIYNPDVAGSFLTFSQTGAAGSGSQNFWIAPADLTLVDAAVVTGIVDTSTVVVNANDLSIGAIQWAAVVNTLANRGVPTISFRAGTKITLTCAA